MPTSCGAWTEAGFPLTLQLPHAKLPKRSWAKISQVRMLSVQRLKKKIGKASVGEMDQFVEGLNELTGRAG